MSPNWSDGDGGCSCPTGQANGLGRHHREGEAGCLSAPNNARPALTVLAELNNAIVPVLLPFDFWKDQDGINGEDMDHGVAATPRVRALLQELGEAIQRR